MNSASVRALALECGFDLAGAARAQSLPEAGFYHDWVEQGRAGEMRYLTDRRAGVRDDPRLLLSSARSIISVGKLYNVPRPYSIQFDEEGAAWISRYAWGSDYHDVLRKGLEELVVRLRDRFGEFEWKICVDTAPLLERAYARQAGLGWIGKNTCVINEHRGSWFFLGELLVSFDVEPDCPPPDRCGTCTRCIDACPTSAIIPARQPGGPEYTVDSRLCISYFTIELRGPIPESQRPGIARHVFGCDICQDVCPWNREAPFTTESAFEPRAFAPSLERLAALDELEFRRIFGDTAVSRARYTGFLRNVAVAMGNDRSPKYRKPLECLAASGDPVVAEHAQWALAQLDTSPAC